MSIAYRTRKVAGDSSAFDYPKNMYDLCCGFEATLIDLIAQIDKMDPVDNLGHPVKMNQAYINAVNALKP